MARIRVAGKETLEKERDKEGRRVGACQQLAMASTDQCGLSCPLTHSLPRSSLREGCRTYARGGGGAGAAAEVGHGALVPR